MSAKLRKLSPSVFVHSPAQPPATSRKIETGPKLIILASWMDARDAPIASLIKSYGSLYPTSKIVLMKFTLKLLLWESDAVQAIKPAVAFIKAQETNGFLSVKPPQPEILVHTFSNGGVASSKLLYEGYRRLTGMPFPLHATIFDSGPGQYSYSTFHHSIMASAPKGPWRGFIEIIVHILNVYCWIVTNMGYLYALVGNANFHNDSSENKETNRTYIYEKEDMMVDWSHVEAHASTAEQNGFCVRKELFTNSTHVGHARADGLRYWKIVEETWELSRQKIPGKSYV